VRDREQPADNSPTAALYTLVSTLCGKDNIILDVVNTTFGVRKLTFDPNKGLLLNDQHVKVKGMCNHQVRTRDTLDTRTLV
jgi:beta-galactosidase/beta-glucuronidase